MHHFIHSTVNTAGHRVFNTYLLPKQKQTSTFLIAVRPLFGMPAPLVTVPGLNTKLYSGFYFHPRKKWVIVAVLRFWHSHKKA